MLLPPCRPPNAQEIAERATQVIQCNEALREVTLYQSVGGKQMSRTFRYDRVRVVWPTSLPCLKEWGGGRGRRGEERGAACQQKQQLRMLGSVRSPDLICT